MDGGGLSLVGVEGAEELVRKGSTATEGRERGSGRRFQTDPQFSSKRLPDQSSFERLRGRLSV